LTPRYRFPKRYADLSARLRVPAGFLLAAAFAWLSRPDSGSLALGLPVAFLGLLLRGWAAGHLAKNRELATSGPYAYTRNPLYLGTLLVAAGLAVAASSWPLAGLLAAFFGAVYLPVIELEEQHLRKLFPAYAEYAARVPRFCPALRSEGRREPARPPIGPGRERSPGERFRFSLFVRNQEYQAVAGVMAGAVYLLWKAG